MPDDVFNSTDDPADVFKEPNCLVEDEVLEWMDDTVAVEVPGFTDEPVDVFLAEDDVLE